MPLKSPRRRTVPVSVSLLKALLGPIHARRAQQARSLSSYINVLILTDLAGAGLVDSSPNRS